MFDFANGLIRVRYSVLLFWLVLASAFVSVGCGGVPRDHTLHYARATPAQLQQAEALENVWYEFRPGDRIPMSFVFLGMAEMAGNNLMMEVKRRFYIVHHRGQTYFSFDGRTIQRDIFSRWGMIVGQGELRGQTAVMMYVGPANEAPAELRRR